MAIRITRPQIRPPGEAPGDSSTQIYVWPARMGRLTRGATLSGIAALAAGFALVAGRSQAQEMMFVTAGLFLVVGGAAVLVGMALAHACLAREVHFHRLYCVIKQTGREGLILPYSNYDDQWLVDFTRPKTL